MRFIINIGLDIQATATISAAVALEIVKANGFIVVTHAVHTSDTEPTLVAVVDAEPVAVRAMAHQTAIDLQQDCIAVHMPLVGDGRRGWLIGPKASAWGQFDPAFFLQMNGTRLGVTATA